MKAKPQRNTGYFYETDDEEYDEEASRTTPRVTTVVPTAAPVVVTTPPVVPAVAPESLANSTMPPQNYTFLLTPANGTFFGSVLTVAANNPDVSPLATTERVHHVLSQVGNIWNSVGSLNITGIVDQALGIRNSQFARPLVTTILNVVLCNPITFSENNCNKYK